MPGSLGADRPRWADLPEAGRPLARELGPMVVRWLLLAAALVVVLWFLHEVRWALLLLLTAGIGAIFLNALVTLLERRGTSRRLGVVAVLGGFLAAAALVGWLVLPRLVREVPAFLETLPGVLTGAADEIAGAFGGSPQVERQLSMWADWVLETVGGLWQYASTALGAILGSIVVLALTLFMVLEPRPLLRGYLLLLPEDWREPAVRAFTRSSRMVVGWVAANVIIGGIRGLAAYFFLEWIGVPGALLWGLLAAVTALIPRVGFYIMVIPPVLVAAAQSLQIALWTAVFLIVFDELLGNFVVPRIQAETMELHPAYILGFTVLMAFSFGVLGVLIAAPVAGMLLAHVQEFHLRGRADDARTEERVDAMLGRAPRRIP